MTHFLSFLIHNRLAFAGMIVMGLIVVLGLLTPYLGLENPDVTDLSRRFIKPFSQDTILGTDHLGRDLLSRLMWGTRLSLVVGFSAALVAATIGSTIGIIAGFYGGVVDNILMRAIDMLMAFPYILLALAIVAVLGPGLMNALLAVAVVNIPFYARNIRGVTVGIVHKEFVDAARLTGMSNTRIMFTEVLPNVMPVIVIAISTSVGWMILEAAGLSFIGLGSQPPRADLGAMLGEARAALITNPHTSIVSGGMIIIIVMAINLLGDGIRDALDPRLKSGALSRPMSQTLVQRADPLQDARGDVLLDIRDLQTEFRMNDRIDHAIKNLDLKINAGEYIGLVGESGSGKSVAALSVMGLISSPPGVITGGAVYYKGDDLIDAPYQKIRALRGRKISYIFQDPLATFHPLHTIGDQLIEAILVHRSVPKSQARTHVLKLLKKVRLPNPERHLGSYPHELSSGMQQRISIAMALVNDPEIIIADEPTTGLDVTVQAQILALLNEIRKERGLSIIFISHDFGVVSQFCDRVAVMYAGEIVEEGPTKEILQKPSHPYTSALLACVPKLGLKMGYFDTIPGSPPPMDKLPTGCSFAERCTCATDACHANKVEMLCVGEDHYVRCIAPTILHQGQK